MSTADAVRAFNRFYTQRIGVLEEGLLDSALSLTQVRVLYELAHGAQADAGQGSAPTAAELTARLGLDPGYLSRIVADFQRRGWVARKADPTDRRRQRLALTAGGRAVFRPLDVRSSKQAAKLVAPLSGAEQARLEDALATVQRLLGGTPPVRGPLVLRGPRSGDLGWVVQRHGALYAQEYGWDERFEALVAGIVAGYVETLDPRRERCWIAEQDGVNVGSVFVVRHTATVAKLRLLLVEPSARGQGLGGRLVEECVAFARASGYRTLTLWTNSVLASARRLYEAAGFVKGASERHRSFGHALVGETWSLALR